jgi:hypothetical protein
MNGYFMNTTQNKPPSPVVKPPPVLTPKVDVFSKLRVPAIKSFLKRFGDPITVGALEAVVSISEKNDIPRAIASGVIGGASFAVGAGVTVSLGASIPILATTAGLIVGTIIIGGYISEVNVRVTKAVFDYFDKSPKK